ncbi:MAG: 1-acyl-sn-glycerol-3-phosphate acyltransferase, partial [Gammaproteobacteria bacterium]|nr:1-acyl-sn-glycerol-3-phosphate acyltransferase [Gammaproteobacteria bacterium]
REQELHHIPLEGPAVIVCNHVSFVDALIIAAAVSRPTRYVMYHRIFKIPILSFVFRTAKAIPIAPAGEDRELLVRAYDEIAAALEAGELVCIFPEGQITADGELNPFRNGIERIVRRTPVPVIPIALRGLWGSFFSRYNRKAMRTWPRRLWSKITVIGGPAVAAADVRAPDLQARVASLLAHES